MFVQIQQEPGNRHFQVSDLEVLLDQPLARAIAPCVERVSYWQGAACVERNELEPLAAFRRCAEFRASRVVRQKCRTYVTTNATTFRLQLSCTAR